MHSEIFPTLEQNGKVREFTDLTDVTVADLGFHEGGFVRSGALARPRKFLKTTPTSGKNHALLRS